MKNLGCIVYTYLQQQASVVSPSARYKANLMYFLPQYATSVQKMYISDRKESPNFKNWHLFWVPGGDVNLMFGNEAQFYLSDT